jgi:aspartate/glutamate racemase
MAGKLVLLHTVPSLIGVFDRLAAELLPGGVQVVHVADGILLTVVLAEGGLTPFIHRRVCDHVFAAEQAAADVVMFTCSSISPCADTARRLASIPVLKVDEPMAIRAVSLGRRISVIATVPTTLTPTVALLRTCADATGAQVVIDPVLCEGAFGALQAGDVDTHDRSVRAAVEQSIAANDVVVLAQASMARVADSVTTGKRVPILSSPRSAMEAARDAIARTLK